MTETTDVRARYGMIVPSSNRMAEPHAARFNPQGVVAHATRVRMTGPHFMELEQLLPKVAEASEILADASCDTIVFHCTANSMAEGLAGEKKIAGAIESATGKKAATTASATMTAFEVLEARRVVLVSPYPRTSHEHELEFLEEAGLEIVGERNLSLDGSTAYSAMPPSDWVDTMASMKNDKADVYFASCANIRAIEVLEEIEEILDAPVVTSNQLVIWNALRLAGIDDPLPGLGRLARA
ncbi:MAG: arylmalonate decarboxylase [Rhodospirillaceae bacterium]|jgi:maleate isomerase|nr:arylmalonate decarboxylase [Rhodospirillaceae bacterium]MBT5455901.1 arylmalonate decarboxylase [Rhodospirillaceae bacterium]